MAVWPDTAARVSPVLQRPQKQKFTKSPRKKQSSFKKRFDMHQLSSGPKQEAALASELTVSAKLDIDPLECLKVLVQ